jgi:hypothetical protein
MTMKGKYPGGMSLKRWSRLPYRLKHKLVGIALNDRFGHWRDCGDRRCRRARTCQDYECYWRRKRRLPEEEQSRMRKAAEPLAELLWIGVKKDSEGLWLY